MRRELHKHKRAHHEDDVGALGALQGPLAVGELRVVARSVVLIAGTLHLANTPSGESRLLALGATTTGIT